MMKSSVRFGLIAALVALGSTATGAKAAVDVKAAYIDSYKYEKTGNYNDAFRALYKVYSESTGDYTVNLRYGWLSYLMNKYADAESYYKAAENAIPTSLEPKLGLALIHLTREDWKKAEQKCNEVIKVDYYNYYGNLRLAYALQGQKKFENAEAIIRKMLAVVPTDVTYISSLAVNLIYQGKYEEGYGLFWSVQILDPENVTAKAYLQAEK